MSVKTPHEWSKEALLNKAQRYATLMLERPRDNWQFGFWSVLCLEMLVRASVASISPVLIADTKDWNNILFALGKKSSGIKLSPKSIDISEVLTRTASLFPGFTREMVNFCTLHFQRRNSELHSGELPFDDIGTSSWLSQYYNCCKVLLETVKVPMTQIFGTEEATTATTLIQALEDGAAKAVKGTINAHQTIWKDKSLDERNKLAKEAKIRSSRADGHRVECPACQSVGLVQGAPAGSKKTTLEDDVIMVRQTMLPSHFLCKACGLKIMGYSKLNACKLGGTFTSTSPYDPYEYYETDSRDDHWTGMEDDNNEP